MSLPIRPVRPVRPVLRDRTGAGAIAGAAAGRPSRRAPFVVLVLVVLLGALTGLLALNTLSAADELEQQSIATANSVTKAQAQQLQVDLAARRAPAALARAASALGMVPANQPAFLRIGTDGSVSLLGVPAPVTPPPITLVPPPAGSTALIPGATVVPGTSATTTAPATTAPTTPTTPTATPTAPTTPTAGATATTPTTPTTTVTLPGGAR